MGKKISKWPHLTIGNIGIIFFLIGILFLSLNLFKSDYIAAGFTNSLTTKELGSGEIVESIQSTDLLEQVHYGIPIRIRIPSINVDAPIESLGLTPQGAMDATDGPINAAWFSIGPRPGEIGSAVIDGHSGWKNNVPAVFDDLYKIQKGDEVYIEDEMGVITTFIVREFQTYGEKDDTSGIFNSSDEVAHLNLITCAGAWNKKPKSSYDRFVVFADKK